jgi:outer membrane receptor protein involved in Fe transport
VKRWCIGSLAAAAIYLAAGPVYAADVPQDPPSPQQAPSLQEVVVTGTRIRAPNITSESPITAVSSTEIQYEGATNIENVVNELPQLHTAQSNTTSNNSTGVDNVNLRGLGPTRSLVLIDGRRLGPGDPQSPEGEAADINFIPAALVSGVDVLTGGASAAYGSDAIAGVVNFHLIRNFQGVQITQTFNDAQHTNGGPWDAMLASAPLVNKPPIPGDNQFGGLVSDTTLILGTNLDQDRGNVTLYVDYRSTNPILNVSRNYLSCETNLNKAGNGLVCGGSSDSAFGNFHTNDGKDYALNPDGSATFVKYDKSFSFNTPSTNYLQRADQRKSLGALGDYRLSEWADVYAEVMLMDDFTSAQVAPGGLSQGQGPTGFLQVPCNNQFLSAAEEPLICQDASGKRLPVYQANGQPNVATIEMPGLRFPNTYPRIDQLRHTDYRAVVGVRGGIGASDWTYDASGTYWDSLLSEHYMNDISTAKLENSLFGCAAPGSTGCVPVNIFQYGAITPAMFNYLSTPGLKTGSSVESTVDANVSGDFGAWGGKSPWAHNPLAATLGVSFRRDQLNFLPDNEFQTNDLIGQGQVWPVVSGSENVTEEYGEIRIPLIEAKPLVKALNLDVADRHSSYSIGGSRAGFSTNTFKVGADYAPTSDIRFRGSFNRAARAPNIYELFFPQSLNTDSGYQDPCSGATPAATLAACAKTGVTPAQYGTIPGCRSSDCGGLFGGNPALRPETADTWTFGFILTPRFAPDFDLSVDYWAVRVGNYITHLAGTQVVNGCLLQGQDSLCSLIHRGPNGIIFGSAGWVTETDQNIGFLRNRGVDLNLHYRQDLDDLGLHHLGSLTFNMTGTYLLEQTISTFASRYDCAGLYGATCSAGDVNGPNFRWRHQARLTWLTPWKLDFSVRWRYLSHVSLDSNDPQPALNSGSYDAYDGLIPAVNYMDLSLSWSVWKQFRLTAGVKNALDVDPPLLNHKVVYRVNGGGNEDVYNAYDVVGRELFLTASVKF